MERVGVRELRLNPSQVLRRVKQGEIVEVTERGRPVARLVPVTYRSVLERMIAEGLATPATGTTAELLALAKTARPSEPWEPSSEEVLAEIRRDRFE